jgi:hypothetical protein
MHEIYRHEKYGIMTFLGLFLLGFLAMTAPILMCLLLLNIPTFFFWYFISHYTRLLKTPRKLYWYGFFELMNLCQRTFTLKFGRETVTDDP